MSKPQQTPRTTGNKRLDMAWERPLLGKQDNFPPWNTLGKSHKYIKFFRCFPSVETYLGNLMFSKSFQAWKMHGIHFVFHPKIPDVFDEFLQKEYLTNKYIM